MMRKRRTKAREEDEGASHGAGRKAGEASTKAGKATKTELLCASFRTLGELLQNRIPRLLLTSNKGDDFGGRHWARVSAPHGELLLHLRLVKRFAQVLAHPADNGVRRADRR